MFLDIGRRNRIVVDALKWRLATTAEYFDDRRKVKKVRFEINQAIFRYTKSLAAPLYHTNPTSTADYIAKMSVEEAPERVAVGISFGNSYSSFAYTNAVRRLGYWRIRF